MQKRKFLTIMMVAVSLSTADIVLADEAGSCHFHGKKMPKEETVSNCIGRAGRWGKKATNGWLSSLIPLLPVRRKESFYLFFTARGSFIAANFTGK